jgi:hypothetical protein
MGFFRRGDDETLNEQLLHEAGLDEAQHESEPADDAGSDAPLDAPLDASQPEPLDPYAGTYPADDPSGTWRRAMARPGLYDTTVTVEASGLAGDSVTFATLESGDLIVDDEQGDADLSPLADAVERELQPPYRAVGRRQEDDLWLVAARGIDLLDVDFDGGDEIELSSIGGTIEVRVDGEPWTGHIPELEHAGEAAEGEDYVVQAERLDGQVWEVRASPL